MFDRIQQVRRASKSLVAGLCVVLAATACGSSEGSESRTGELDDNATVRVAGTLVGTDLDPFKAGGQLQNIVNIYDSLIAPQFDFSLEPSLATEWSWSSDNLELTLKLREDVTFSDGSAFDSSAVVASLDRAKNGTTSTVKTTLTPITAVTATDPNTVVIKTDKPFPALPSILASPAGMVINPKMIKNEAAIQQGALGVGTGPYVVDTFTPSTILSLNKRTDYWDEESIKHAPAKFVYNYVLDGNARLNGLRSGQYDLIAVGGVPGIRNKGILPPDSQLSLTPSMYVFGVSFAFDRPPFNNEKVRQAIQHGVDWKSMVSNVLTDVMLAVEKPSTQIALDDQLGHDDSFELPTYDPDMAKQLLADAGFPNGKGLAPVTMTSSTASNDIYIAQTMQPQLAKLGIEMKIDQQASSIYTKAQINGGQANMISGAFTSGGGIDLGLTYNVGLLGSPSFVDKASPAGQEFVSLIQEAAVTPSDDERAKLYQQAEELAHDHAFYIPFVQNQVGFAGSKKIKGLQNSLYARNATILIAGLTVSK